MDKMLGQRWLWMGGDHELAIAEIVELPRKIKVLQILKGSYLSGSKVGETLNASWEYTGKKDNGGWSYLEGQDRPQTNFDFSTKG